MSPPLARRGFLTGLTTLPLIGGGVALTGAPVAVAEPPSRILLESYSAWLSWELRFLNATIYPRLPDGRPSMRVPMLNAGASFHINEPGVLGLEGWRVSGRYAQARAALVLAAVGCDWREGDR